MQINDLQLRVTTIIQQGLKQAKEQATTEYFACMAEYCAAALRRIAANSSLESAKHSKGIQHYGPSLKRFSYSLEGDRR